ncbi:MAG: fused MFS/spermidine synthase [Lentisphaeria bacterium]|nr:fused MFS/spermidine synthase [Lentisphaeria bacterium]
MKQLGLLFGNTSHAAAATLAAFFAGLAVGSWFWGKRVGKSGNALRAYAWLETGIAVTALLYFIILECFYVMYPLVYQRVDSAALLLLIKFSLAIILIFPPAFCMGGTIPAIGQYLIRRPETFGGSAALLYGINTLGAAAGAFLAGFYLPLWFGFRLTCLGAMTLTGLVAAAAFLLSRQPLPPMQADTTVSKTDKKNQKTQEEKAPLPVPPGTRGASLRRGGWWFWGLFSLPSGRWAITLVCFLSGFGVLALEVLWIRMFSQVLENSVYTFAAILVIVLLCLAVGALISSVLARLKVPAMPLLALLILVGAISVAATPFVFMGLTDSLRILVSTGSWTDYVALIFKNGFLTVGPPALLLGTVFPFLMKAEEKHLIGPGMSLGRLAAINTAGAILGSLLCGFVFLELLGMWGSMQLIAAIYIVAALILPTGWGIGSIITKVGSGFFLILLFSTLSPARLPITSTDPLRQQEKILEVWEGSDCTVAVARDMYGLAIKINSHYGLGSTGSYMQAKFQADIPLMIRPETASVFFLGMGTGITAGSALDPQFENITRVVACELVPEVVTAAEKYMTDVNGFDFTGGLFTDDRAAIIVEDGRHYLMGGGESFDMINSDLFVPFRSGAGSLYTREHFTQSKKRLNPGGLFVQWLPLYQLTENEFSIIARTMLDVFDQVSLWRNNFQPGEEVVALIGHADSAPLPPCDIDSRADKQLTIQGKDHRDLQHLRLPFNPQTVLFFYCGNLTAARELFTAYPVNTDDKPLIEYMAPRTYRNEGQKKYPWFVGPRIIDLVTEIQTLCPPEHDPLLVNRTAANRRLPLAGAAFHQARLWEVTGDEQKCRAAWDQFVDAWVD